MNQFIQRVANYIANEVLIKGLANSKTFQRFAIRMDASIKEAQEKGTKQFSTILEETVAKDLSKDKTGPPKPPLRGVPGFLSAFVKEVRKDLGI